MYGGRMRLVKGRRSPSASVRRSLTRGALTAIVPASSVTFRVRPLPLRTTRACPSSSRSARCASRYTATSISRAATSIRRAPSRAISSSKDRLSTSSCVASSPTLSMDGASFPSRALGRRSIKREDTPLASRAPRSTTCGHTSKKRTRGGLSRGGLDLHGAAEVREPAHEAADGLGLVAAFEDRNRGRGTRRGRRG